jgi:hypothetical protein
MEMLKRLSLIVATFMATLPIAYGHLRHLRLSFRDSHSGVDGVSLGARHHPWGSAGVLPSLRSMIAPCGAVFHKLWPFGSQACGLREWGSRWGICSLFFISSSGSSEHCCLCVSRRQIHEIPHSPEWHWDPMVRTILLSATGNSSELPRLGVCVVRDGHGADCCAVTPDIPWRVDGDCSDIFSVTD